MIIEKWQPILEYESENIPKLPSEKWKEVAHSMEECDRIYGEYAYDFAKYLIPQIRRNEGPLKTLTIQGTRHFLVEFFDLAFALPESGKGVYFVKTSGVTIPMGNVYHMDKNGEWVNMINYE